MTRRRVAPWALVVTFAAGGGCSLFTPLDGLSSGDDETVPPDASAPPLDAPGSETTGPCTSRTAILGGDATTLMAVRDGVGPFRVTSAPQAVTATPGLIAMPGGRFNGVFPTSSAFLWNVVYDGAAWSAPTQMVNYTSLYAPSFANLGAETHVIWRGNLSNLVRLEYQSGGWSAADPLPTSTTSNAPSFCAYGGTLYTSYVGASSPTVYVRTLANDAWGNEAPVPAASSSGSPQIVALEGGAVGAPSILLVYPRDQGDVLMWTTLSGSTWSAPAAIDGSFASADVVSLAALPGGRAIVAARTPAGVPHYAVFDPGSTPAWSKGAPIVTTTIDGAVAIAAGVCGDVAVATWGVANDDARVARLQGSAWSAPEAVTGFRAARFTRVATSP